METVRPFAIDNVAPPEGLAAFQWPAPWQNGILASAPLDLEIGCGVGWHPIRYSKTNPDRRLIAIEHTRAKFERFQSRLERHERLPNLLPVHGDAIRWVTHALVPNSIDRCLLMYPNPEPKAPNKRWFRSSFMHRLLDVLKPGGELVLATNEEFYWQEAKKYALEFWRLELIESRSFNSANAPTTAPRTHFEKKYLERGETCFDLRARKP